MNKPDIDKTRMTLAIEVTERACAKLAKQAHPQKKAQLVQDLYDLFGNHLCIRGDIVGIPILTEEQLLKQLDKEKQEARERALAEEGLAKSPSSRKSKGNDYD